jgi:extracellular elastinolytic metalloproteinase
MKFVFAGILLAAAVCLSTGKSLPMPRTAGNFEPSIKNTFELRPQFVHALASSDPIATAKAFISLKNNVAEESVRVASTHTSTHNGVTHVYLQQVVNGLDVSNGVANVNIDRSGKVLSAGNSFFTQAAPAPSFAHSTAAEAVASFAKFLDISAGSLTEFASASVHGAPSFSVHGASFAVKPIVAELKYTQLDGGAELSLVWSLQVEMKDNYYNAFIDTTTGNVVALIDWVSDATYNVFPVGINDPESGERVKLVDPAHAVASPNGWHDQGDGETFTDTIGNNVYAHENFDGGSDYINNYRPDGGSELNFDFPLDLATGPKDYIDSAVTNLFYWNNIIHDLFYVYGFNEESGNFQQNNLGRGGAGNDAVVAHAQSGEGTNNANFATPPDGQKGTMRMYVWDITNPNRDGISREELSCTNMLTEFLTV